MTKQNKRSPWVMRGVILLVVLLIGFVWLKRRQASVVEEEAPLETVKVERGEIRATVTASGTIQPETSVDIKANVGGEVTSLVVDVGDKVKAGDLVATIDPEDAHTSFRTASADLDSARASAQQALSAVAMERAQIGPREREAQAAVKRARAQLTQSEENLRLQRSTAQQEVASAEQGVTSAKASLSQAEAGLRRDSTTVQTDVITARQTQQEAASKVEQAAANLDLQRQVYAADLESARQGRTAAQARLRTAEVEARTRVASGAAAVQQAEANLAGARQRLAKLQTASQPREAASAQGEYDAAKASLAVAEAETKRQRELNAKGFVAYSAVEQADIALASARSRFATAEQGVKNLKAQQTADLAEAKASVAASEAALEQARQSQQQSGTASNDLAAARASLAQAESDVKRSEAAQQSVVQREAELAQAKSALERAKQATRAAEAKTVQADISSSGVTVAEASAKQAETSRDRAVANRRQVAIREAEVAAAREALVQAEASFQNLIAQRLKVPQLTAQVRQSGATITRREAEVTDAQKQLKDTIIRSPRAGVVIERFVEEGTIITSGRSSVSEGTKIVTLADISKLYCLAQVDEADVSRVQIGQPAMMTIESFPNAKFKATVRKVYPQGVEESDVVTFTVELEVDTAGKEVRPGMTAEAEILTDTRENVLTVPAGCVREGPSGFLVQVMKDGVPTDMPVKVGVQTFDNVEIKEGLTEGDLAIVPASAGSEGGQGGAGGSGGRSSSNDSNRNFQRAVRRGVGGMRGGR